MFASGIFAFSCPVRIPEKSGGAQQTVARISLAARAPRIASGPAEMRAVLAAYLPDIHSDVFPELLDRLKAALDAEQTRIVMRFPYFLEKRAPVTRTSSLMEYSCAFSAVSGQSGEPVLTVRVPLTTLCPCSKEISEAGAHNQRARVTLTVRPRALIWLEDLVDLVESCASCGVYALMKNSSPNGPTSIPCLWRTWPARWRRRRQPIRMWPGFPCRWRASSPSTVTTRSRW